MSAGNEFMMLLQSDVGGAAVDHLTSVFGLWVRNNMIHFAFGFIAYFVEVYSRSVSLRGLALLFLVYLFLQVVQVATAVPAARSAAVLDGLWDIGLPLAGFLMAMWMSAREVAR